MEEAAAGHDPRLERGVRAVLAAAAAMPRPGEIRPSGGGCREVDERGYFLPDEDERVRTMWARFLSVRAVLGEALESLEPLAGRSERDWESRFDAFLAAFAAACLLVRGGAWVVELGTAHRVLRRKLDEAEPLHGIPRKTFTRVFRAGSSPWRLARFSRALDFYRAHRDEVAARARDPLLGPVVDLLAAMDDHLPRRRRLWGRLLLYPWFSFKRRHHSGYKKAMFGILRIGGLGGVGTETAGGQAARRAQAGVGGRSRLAVRIGCGRATWCSRATTMPCSNWFLPGFWPHASLFLGSPGRTGGVRASSRAGRPPERRRRCSSRRRRTGCNSGRPGRRWRWTAVAVLRPPLRSGGHGGGARPGDRPRGQALRFRLRFPASPTGWPAPRWSIAGFTGWADWSSAWWNTAGNSACRRSNWPASCSPPAPRWSHCVTRASRGGSKGRRQRDGLSRH